MDRKARARDNWKRDRSYEQTDIPNGYRVPYLIRRNGLASFKLYPQQLAMKLRVVENLSTSFAEQYEFPIILTSSVNEASA